MANLTYTLPKGLSDPDNLGKVRKAVTQWSKVVAWSWSSYLAFADNPQQAEEEKKLKQILRKILQTQAQNLSAFTAYGQQDSKEIADNASEIFKYLLGGQNNKLSDKGIQLTLTLSDVLKKLTDEDYIFTVDQEFLDKFTFEITVDFHSGTLREDTENPGKYISVMAYPAPPPFNEATVTEEQLIAWITTPGSGEYLPPSAYIPLCAT
ncbi:hypothetical protein WKK05_20860 [Nostoc sp. UHCC 0302]|uniref:hypothetical protein n=1 Tax=Nostoc sp. UHCC 0302 TaxID=3134896 RepID=UPI00311C9D7C